MGYSGGMSQFAHDQSYQENLSGNDYEEYYAEQMALPEHKRDGYAERMAERADIARDAMMDNLPF